MPFPTNPALEKAVIADCENDLPRLVYADWLDEHGDPARAAFIRTQIALHDKSPADLDFIDLELTRDELVVQLADREDLRPLSIDGLEFPWHLGLASLVTDGYFERGFPAVASVSDYEVPVGVLRRMLATTTLRGLSSSNDVMSATLLLLSAPETASLTSLAIQFFAPDFAAALSDLRSSPIVKGLRRLSVRQPYASEGTVRTLAGIPFRKLNRLELPLGASSRAEVGVFLKAEWVRRLRDVRLTASPGPPAEPMMKGLASLLHLHTLSITGCRHFSLAALKKKQGFPALGKLELRHANLRGEQADALAACDFPRLAVLGLDGSVPASAVKKLAASDWFPSLRALEIGSNQLTARGVEELTAASNLRSLALYDAELTGKPLHAIATGFPELRSLELRKRRGHTTTDREVAGLLGGLVTSHLRNLSLRGFSVGPQAVTALAANPALSNLTLLRLEDASMTAEGVESLVTAPHLQRLIGLDFLGNSITTLTTGGEGLAALLDPAVMPNLVTCGTPKGVSDELGKRLEAARPGLRLV